MTCSSVLLVQYSPPGRCAFTEWFLTLAAREHKATLAGHTVRIDTVMGKKTS